LLDNDRGVQVYILGGPADCVVHTIPLSILSKVTTHDRQQIVKKFTFYLSHELIPLFNQLPEDLMAKTDNSTETQNKVRIEQ